MAAANKSVLQGLLRVVGYYSESGLARQKYRCLAYWSRQYSLSNTPKDANSGEDGTVDPDLTRKQHPLTPKIDVTMTPNFTLKVTVKDHSAQPGDSKTANAPVTMFERIDFSSLERQLASFKITPYVIRWLPRSLRSAFFNSVLSAALKKGFLNSDFDLEDFNHFGGLASMKLADMVSSGDFAGLKDLIAGDASFSPVPSDRPELENFDSISPCSADDLVWSGLSKVMIQDHSPQDGIIHVTLHTLCRFNAQLKESSLPTEKVIFGSNMEIKIFYLLLKRIACTFQQHYSLDSNHHSEWRASELAQAIDIVPVVIPNFPAK